MALTCICPSPKPTVQAKEERRNSIKYKQYNKEHICTLLVIILSELHMTVTQAKKGYPCRMVSIDFDSNKISLCAQLE